MSSGIEVEVVGLDVVMSGLRRLGVDRRGLLEVIGSEVESQTRRRLESEKTGPDGEAWPAWSEGYAKLRRSGGGLLDFSGSLIDSIAYEVQGDDAVEVGSNLPYARRHQVGDDDPGIPARPFVGLSPANEREIERTLSDWLGEAFA